MARSYSFTHAIVRQPSLSAVNGLRAVDQGAPDLTRFKEHHAAYVDALRTTGAEVHVAEPLEAYPDAVFVEDTALCLNEGVVLMRPGAPTRIGEVDHMEPILRRLYDDVVAIEAPAFIEGGDILTTEREVLIGLSNRTTTQGVEALRSVVTRWGYTVRQVQTPPGVLHFKTDCSLLDEETILATPRLNASGCFEGYRVIETASGEEASANAIRFNNLVLMADGFPRTQERLVSAGYDVRVIGNSEAAKLDGGMSCLSLRFTPPAR